MQSKLPSHLTEGQQIFVAEPPTGTVAAASSGREKKREESLSTIRYQLPSQDPLDRDRARLIVWLCKRARN